MQSYKGFEYPTVREFFADEEKYTNPDNENQWLYYLGGVNIVIDKDKGNKEIDEIFKHFIDVVYEDAKKVNGAVADAIRDAQNRGKKAIDEIVQEKTTARAKELHIDIDTLNKAASANNDLSDEELEKISNAFNNVLEESEELKKISELPSNNGVEELDPSEVKEVGEFKDMQVATNPINGEKQILGEAKDDDLITESFESMLDRINTDKLEFGNDNPLTDEEISKYLSKDSPFADAMISDVIKSDENYPLSREDTKVMMDITNRRMQKEDFNIYRALPESVKKMVDTYLAEVSGVRVPMNSIEINTMRNRTCEALIDDLISNIQMDRVQSDFGKEVQQIFSKGAADVSEAIIGYSNDKLESYRKSLEKVTDPKKKERLTNILKKIEDAYSLESLKEYATHCKIKKFDLEKPNKYYSRFVNKYKASVYDAYSINMIKPILLRHLNENGDEYTEKDVDAFFIAFCKYTTNYKVEDILDHSYMYFVTYNVALVDINVSENTKEVSDIFLNNVKDVISNLRECNKGVL